MNIKELIEKLKQFDPETLVVVDGYEKGLDDINNIKKTIIRLNPQPQPEYWDQGKYWNDKDIAWEYQHIKPKNTIAIKAIVLSRFKKNS